MKKPVISLIKIFLQFLLVFFLIVFLARVNYLPVIFPESAKEWIIDVSDNFFKSLGIEDFSEFAQNLVTFEFLDKDVSENKTLIQNQKNNFNTMLKEVNESLNKITGSFEVLLALSPSHSEFNLLRARYYLSTIINTETDYDAFHIWCANKKQFVVNVANNNFTPKNETYTALSAKIDYDKLAQFTEPIVFFRDKKLIIAYAFKGDTLEEKGILFATLSTHFFERDLSKIKDRKFFNYAIYKNSVAYLYKNPNDAENYQTVQEMINSDNYIKHFTEKKGIIPNIGYRVSKQNFIIKNPLFPGESVNVTLGIIYPKNILISLIANIILLTLIIGGIWVIIKMLARLRLTYNIYTRLKEAPYLLLDDTLNKMGKVFDKMITSTKRIKTNVDEQKILADRLLKVAPPKAIGYEEKKETKTETYGFAKEEENINNPIG